MRLNTAAGAGTPCLPLRLACKQPMYAPDLDPKAGPQRPWVLSNLACRGAAQDARISSRAAEHRSLLRWSMYSSSLCLHRGAARRTMALDLGLRI